MATAELKDDATHEEIQEMVDQIAEDRKGDAPESGKLEGPSDAERFARDENTAAEDASGSDGGDATNSLKSKTADEGEETGDPEDQVQDWLDDTLKAEVAAYGIDEKELADFASREEVERALRFFDRNALAAGRKAMAESEQGRDEKGQSEKKVPEPKDEEPREGQHEINLSDIWDEEAKTDLTGEFTRMRDHYDSRVAALEERFAEADVKMEERHFDSIVDSLGHADLFGKSGKESAKELQRREDLLVSVKAQRIGLQQLGRPTDLDESLVSRVARMVFAEELGKKDLKARTRKISKQTDGRMGGGATRPTSVPESAREEADRLFKEMSGS